MDWVSEIVQLHAFFQGYFLGELDEIERFESVLHDDFSMIDPSGSYSTRSEILARVRAGHAHTKSLEIVTSDHALVSRMSDVVVARYVETHHLHERSNHRITSVVFVADHHATNGVSWLHAHETWLDRE
jgi:hypothetical protein